MVGINKPIELQITKPFGELLREIDFLYVSSYIAPFIPEFVSQKRQAIVITNNILFWQNQGYQHSTITHLVSVHLNSSFIAPLNNIFALAKIFKEKNYAPCIMTYYSGNICLRIATLNCMLLPYYLMHKDL